MSPKRPRIIKFLLIAFLFISVFFLFCFGHKVFLPARANEGTYFIKITKDITWHKDDNLNFTKGIIITNGATLTIEKGSKISFTQTSFDFVPTLQVEDGRVIAQGTADERIIFEPAKDSQFSITFSDSKGANLPSFFRYVQFKNLGFLNAVIGENNGWADTALAYFDYYHYPAFLFRSGKVHMENCEFINSFFTSIVTDFSYYGEGYESNTSPDSYLEIVNSNFFSSGEQQAVDYNQTCQNYNEMDEQIDCPKPKVLLKNNWYGNSQGPFIYDENCIYEKEDEEDCDPKENQESVVGEATVEGFRQNDLIADPVVIVPGILGSEKVSGQWKLDPILHTYDDLLDSLKTNGFESEKNLFIFPYDWHRSNENTAKDLKEKVDKIIDDTKVSKVDLVAHSMGGLVAREYLEFLDNTKVDQLITLGTPHHGAPESYLTWENGEGFFGFFGEILKMHLINEAKHSGRKDFKSYIKGYTPSVEELLPDYNYLINASDNKEKNYPNGYPKNNFLEDLNKKHNVDNLSNIDFTNIIGVLSNKNTTISNIRVTEDTHNGDWSHGMPEKFYDKKSDRGINYGKGDETVPKESAENIESDKKIIFSAEHLELPLKTQCEIFEKLTDKSACKYVDKWHIPGFLYINIFSPIDVQITSPSGKKLGKDFKTGGVYNEISGAFYSGYDTDSEFLTIPNPENGEYKIIAEGTGNGNYKIEVSNIQEKDGEATSETKAFSGIAKNKSEDELQFKLNDQSLEGATPDSAYSSWETEDEKGKDPDEKTDSDELKITGDLNEIINQIRILYQQKFIRNKKEYKYIKKSLSDIKKLNIKLSSTNREANLKTYNKNLKNKKKKLGHLLYHLGKHHGSYSHPAYDWIKSAVKSIP